MFSSVAFYYKDVRFVTRHRSELYGRIDFLANCGGLLGLYLGCSFLSIVEIIYFFTMRYCSNYFTEKKSKESDDETSVVLVPVTDHIIKK
ncbi:hypothetical protein C0J52_07056 [Blattella germanica]|nr:hypothetical protein C0J52_07056 [Blattella germanica]